MSGVCGKEAWRVSLHGGHSSGYCDHATSTLAEILEAACDAGMRTYGVTDMPDRVVWLPLNSPGSAVHRELGVTAGSIVGIGVTR